MISDLFIDDGYTTQKTVQAVAGLYPELKIIYRPALSKERHAIRAKTNTTDPIAIDNAETELIVKYALSINGASLKEREKVTRLKPSIRGIVVDLILGYSAEDEKDNAVNLATA